MERFEAPQRKGGIPQRQRGEGSSLHGGEQRLRVRRGKKNLSSQKAVL